MSRKKGQAANLDIATQNFVLGQTRVAQHPLFCLLSREVGVIRYPNSSICPRDMWAMVTQNGTIYAHPTRRGEPEEWAYVLAHCMLHLAFEHFQPQLNVPAWNAACDTIIAQFLANLKLGRPPDDFWLPSSVAGRTEERVYSDYCRQSIPDTFIADMIYGPPVDVTVVKPRAKRWQKLFLEGLSEAVSDAVVIASGQESSNAKHKTAAQHALTWFINSYPLLGALAATFTLVEDPLVCTRLDISTAAVDEESREIFINPAAGLDQYEYRFVLAHELLHVGLRHDTRREGRDPFLWNVACDYVINGWLVEMGVGELPHIGGLYDPALKGESAEAIYDRIVTDMRYYRKLATLRGIAGCDILKRDVAGRPDGMALDDFYRRCLAQGLTYHTNQGRGMIPAGLVEEIQALSQPPIGWDVALARWFDDHFAPIELRRTYAIPSRRQASTPDIPRPSYQPIEQPEDGRTFGVVLDTSGSMDRTLLAKALGAIASYSLARDVPAVRVVFCDATTYDQGYMPPEAIAEKVRVRGRGGTILQPGIDLVEEAADFPKDGPLLIITDGLCDRLRVQRDHAFLLPQGHTLPFVPRGPIFRLS